MRKHLTRHTCKLALCVLCALTLSACQGGGIPVRTEPTVTLPPASQPYIAPIGDAALAYTQTSTLFLPTVDGERLVAVTQEVGYSLARLDAESLVRSLLQSPGDAMTQPLGGDVKLALYGANPVEVSGDVATVNLAASALQLDRDALYLCAQAIANTLCTQKNIRYVNLLVMDKQIGLDLASTLPMGALTRNVTNIVSGTYEQALTQRVQPGEAAQDKRLNATVALYFPLRSRYGVMSEARNISFSGQTPEQMIAQILQTLSTGPVTTLDSPPIPLLEGLTTQAPVIDEPESGGGKRILLKFDSALWDMLQNVGVPRVNFLASICDTLTTFIPNIAGLTVVVGEERIDHVMMGATDGVLFTDGLIRRADFAPFLLDNATLYFANPNGDGLVATRRPIAYYKRTNPRALLLELFAGPGEADSVQQLGSVLPTNTLGDADILGLALSEQTLLLNVSTKFSQALTGLSGQQARQLAYAIANTLLCSDRAKMLCLFQSGLNLPSPPGDVDWSGVFYPNPEYALQAGR